jgi:hypothetical protein
MYEQYLRAVVASPANRKCPKLLEVLQVSRTTFDARQVCVCACVCVCGTCACVHASMCVRSYVYVCVRVCACVSRGASVWCEGF